MRIRRRPPGQPLAYLLPSDPPVSQPPTGAPGDRRERPAGDRKQEGELHLHPNAGADLGDERSPAARRAALLPLLPQGSVAERNSNRGLGAQQQQQGPAGDGHRSLEKGHHHAPAWAESVIKAAELLSNDVGVGVGAAVASPTTTGADNDAVKQPEIKNDSNSSGGGGTKKPRGPGVLQEGSRCSRKNGRGWRCSQPTLVGYALCQYHLGKGRVRSPTAAGGRSAGQLGRTEHVKRVPAAVAVATAAPPKADDVPPPPPSTTTTHGIAS